jgi:hypothetical protein
MNPAVRYDTGWGKGAVCTGVKIQQILVLQAALGCEDPLA